MSLTVAAIITARGGSKGVPGKNLFPVAGRPLIAWTIAAALAARGITRLIVSTDDAAIAEACRQAGADAPFPRPAALAADDTPHAPVVLHALEWLKAHEGLAPDYALLLQPTSPLRAAGDITAAIALAAQRRPPAVVGLTESPAHPWLIKRLGPRGEIEAFCPPPAGASLRRQDLPPAQVINGAIYLVRPADLAAGRGFCPPGALAHVMPPERSLDVDTAADLALADRLLRERGPA